MLRLAVIFSAVIITTACSVHPSKVYVVDGHRYNRPVVVVHKQPARHADCWRVKAGRWHCYK